MEQTAEISRAPQALVFPPKAASFAKGTVDAKPKGTVTDTVPPAIGPAALLLKPLIHDMAAGLENAATLLKISQKAFQGSAAETVGSNLESVNANLFKLMGLTEEYCSLFCSLDKKGKIPTGRYDLQVDTIEVVIDELADEIRRKKITVKYRRNKNTAYHPRTVLANRVLLSSAFRTLFTNAIKYCRANGTIIYGFTDGESEHQINIAYEGQPLSEAGYLPGGTKTEPGNIGTGYGNSSEAFGLSVAGCILRNYGGSLACKSSRAGSRFVVTLPA